MLSRLRTFARTTRAGAVIETAILLPTVLFLGVGGIELTNLALAHMRVSQAASTLADAASRVSIDTGAAMPQMREADVNELLQSLLERHKSLALEQDGRVILSSLEQNAEGGQWIHWQRCAGHKDFPSSYGTEGIGKTGTHFTGMGEDGQRVKAPRGTAVMFVEIAYDYQPLAYGSWMGPKEIRYTSSFLVRDDRDLSQIYNPEPEAKVAAC